jgi:hypothetical protein
VLDAYYAGNRNIRVAISAVRHMMDADLKLLRYLPLVLILTLVGCGGGSSSPAPQQPNQLAVVLSPLSASMGVGTSKQFTATVTGTSNTAVTWSVDGVNGGNPTVGAVSTSGLYTSPALEGNHTVTATCVANTGTSASAQVTVQGTAAVSPSSVQLAEGATQQFSAMFQGVSNSGVTWSVDGTNGGSATAGTVTAVGLYTAPLQPGSHTITAISAVDATLSASATITVNGLTITPTASTVLPSATLQFTAAGSSSSISWSVDGATGGSAQVGTISQSGLYTAPFATGAHVIAASLTSNPSVIAKDTLTVINSSPGAVLTYHNDDARDGAFTSETTLTPLNVNSATFGKLFTYTVDGQVYAQPLYLPQLSIGGVKHNVVFVATEANSVFAFDANGSQTTPLWSVNLGVPVPKNDQEGVSPQLGITSTPVIDITTGTMYVLAETTSGPFTLHALDVTTGKEKFGGPIVVTGSVAGTGWDSVGGSIALESSCYQRTSLALNPATNSIYLGFGHCNHGWLLAYDKTTLKQTAIFNDTPDGAGGGLWGGGGAPAINDQTGDVFLITGVDLNDPPSGYNDAFLRLTSSNLAVGDYFQPDNEAFLRANDADLGSGSAILMPDNTSSTPHEIVGGGKDGRIFVVNRDNMGSFNPTVNNVIETVQTGVQQFDNIFSTPVYWNGFVYYHCESDVLQAFSWSNGMLSMQPTSSGSAVYSVHGATSSLSANGTTNGIVWEIDNSNYGTGPSILHAYNATDVATELYNSSQTGSRDTAGLALKFTVPTIAGGEVFVPTANELDIYGLLP